MTLAGCVTETTPISAARAVPRELSPVTLTVYVPSATRAPLASSPSQIRETLRPEPEKRRTTVPSAALIRSDQSTVSLAEKRTVVASARPSPSGLKSAGETASA